ncbi:MAG TPA: type II toxin-antitoxin system RelE/ParE family toxin [Methylocystis sp.]|nr:type II toxin-antitoxin system RelE/ParE family toxin [Methylocystis sp.]
MAHRVVFRPAAEKDLIKLYRSIAFSRGETTVASGYVRRIREYCEGLADFPERGSKRDDLRLGLRIVGFERRIVIAFTFDDKCVRIGRIFYGGRDYETLLGGPD